MADLRQCSLLLVVFRASPGAGDGWLRPWVEYVGAGGRNDPQHANADPLELAPERQRGQLAAISIASLI